MIPVGTLCYYVNLVEYPELNGRTVEVVGYYIDEEDAAWHVVDAQWLHAVFSGRDVTAQAANLRPLTPPRSAAPGTRERLPDKVA